MIGENDMATAHRRRHDANDKAKKARALLCSSYLIGGGRHITASARPVDMDVFALRVLLASKFGLDAESVRAKVVALGLEEIRRQVLATITIIEAESSAEGRQWNAPQRALANNFAPAVLSVVDSLVEEVVEEQILEVRVLSVCRRDVLQEHGSNDATTAPHERNRRLVEFPAIFLRRLQMSSRVSMSAGPIANLKIEKWGQI